MDSPEAADKNSKGFEAKQKAYSKTKQNQEAAGTSDTHLAVQRDTDNFTSTTRRQELAERERNFRAEITTKKRKHESILVTLDRKQKSAKYKLLKKQVELENSKEKLTKANVRVKYARVELAHARQSRETSSAVSTVGAVAVSITGVGLGALVNAILSSSSTSAACSRAEDRVLKAERNAKSKRDEVSRIEKQLDMAQECVRTTDIEIDTITKALRELNRKD